MYGIGIAKGLALTLKHAFRKRFTVQYPEERLPLPARFRGYEFAWDVDRCTGCASCAKACPHGVIHIATSVLLEENRYQVERFEIDIGRCIFCGLCVETCPYEALYMGSQFELANYRRQPLVLNRDHFIAAVKQPSAYARPGLLVKGTEPTEEAR